MFFINGKKADMPTVILVLSVLALCGIALISFSAIQSKVTLGFYESIDAMQSLNLMQERAYFYRVINKPLFLLPEFNPGGLTKRIDSQIFGLINEEIHLEYFGTYGEANLSYDPILGSPEELFSAQYKFNP